MRRAGPRSFLQSIITDITLDRHKNPPREIRTALAMTPPAIPILSKRIMRMTEGRSFSSSATEAALLAFEVGVLTSKGAEVVEAVASLAPASHAGVSDIVLRSWMTRNVLVGKVGTFVRRVFSSPLLSHRPFGVVFRLLVVFAGSWLLRPTVGTRMTGALRPALDGDRVP